MRRASVEARVALMTRTKRLNGGGTHSRTTDRAGYLSLSIHRTLAEAGGECDERSTSYRWIIKDG